MVQGPKLEVCSGGTSRGAVEQSLDAKSQRGTHDARETTFSSKGLDWRGHMEELVSGCAKDFRGRILNGIENGISDLFTAVARGVMHGRLNQALYPYKGMGKVIRGNCGAFQGCKANCRSRSLELDSVVMRITPESPRQVHSRQMAWQRSSDALLENSGKDQTVFG